MNFDQAPHAGDLGSDARPVTWRASIAAPFGSVQSANQNELTTEQGLQAGWTKFGASGEPLMVFTGGDPLKRPDLFDLARYSVKIGLRTNVTPSATPLLTNQGYRPSSRKPAISRMAISRGRPDAPKRTTILRGIPGTFDRAP